MANLVNDAFLLFAEQPPQAPPGPNYQFLLLLGCAVVFMFFIMSLPQKRERNRWNAMVEALKKNDRVLMSSGIIGKVHSVHKEKNEIIIKIDDDSNTKMTFSLMAVSRILDQQAKEGGPDK